MASKKTTIKSKPSVGKTSKPVKAAGKTAASKSSKATTASRAKPKAVAATKSKSAPKASPKASPAKSVQGQGRKTAPAASRSKKKSEPPRPVPLNDPLNKGPRLKTISPAELNALINRASHLHLDNSKHFTQKEIEQFRQSLLALRERIDQRLNSPSGDGVRSSARDATGDLSQYSLHPADQGTDTFDRDRDLILASGGQQLLNEIESALSRIEYKTFGMCELTGQPIEKERLKAIPYARYCLMAQSAVEQQRGRSRPFGPASSMTL